MSILMRFGGRRSQAATIASSAVGIDANMVSGLGNAHRRIAAGADERRRVVDGEGALARAGPTPPAAGWCNAACARPREIGAQERHAHRVRLDRVEPARVADPAREDDREQADVGADVVDDVAGPDESCCRARAAPDARAPRWSGGPIRSAPTAWSDRRRGPGAARVPTAGPSIPMASCVRPRPAVGIAPERVQHVARPTPRETNAP